MKNYLLLLSTLLILGSCTQDLKEPAAVGPLPSDRHMDWYPMEYYAFVHFNINTFTDREWGEGTEDPSLFNPTRLDCDQWVRVFKRAGMKGVIITAKHHDGFCLWPSKYTDHTVASSPWKDGKGDVLKELSEACAEHGLKMGIYMSPWDRHEPSYGDSPTYNEHFKNQLREVLTNYGDIFEVWFDGACGEGPNGKKQVYDWDGFIEVVRELQPNAVIFSDAGPDIRWIGNENGFAGETNWAFLRRDQVYPGYKDYHELTEGHANGTHYVPGECDVSIRPGWYYHESQDTMVKSLDDLKNIYYKSIGRNASLLLNVPPDRNGLIHQNDVQSLMAFKKEIDRIFEDNIALEGTVSANNVRANDPAFKADNVLDADYETYWSVDDTITTQPIIEIAYDQMRQVNHILLQEYVPLGQKVSGFIVEGYLLNKWHPIAIGTTIGYKRIIAFPTVAVEKIRVRIHQSRGVPCLSNIELYHDRKLNIQ